MAGKTSAFETAGVVGPYDQAGAREDAAGHLWVGAALVGLGQGSGPRAEHAARTGRHVLPSRTRVEVLEVYCVRCRVGYSERSCQMSCEGAGVRAVVHTRPAC